jgi:acetylornithine deacetylase
MPLDVVETLSELVAIPSVNPMGRPLSGPEFFEYRLTEYLAGLFQRLGLPYVRQTIEPRRDNIVARLDGTVPPEQGGPLVMFEAHQDTVPVDGMTIPPWLPVVRDGRLYGRGACDIKGGMAAMLWALARLVQDRSAAAQAGARLPTLIMACTVNEEHGFSGAQDLRHLWEASTDGFIPRRPDACVVAEPTSLQVVVAHKGAVRWRLSTRGRAVHSSQPHLGDNALYKMARVLLALEQYAAHVQQSVPHHPLCGPATLSVGTIQGGISVNTVPDRCTIEIDRRLLPGEDAQAAYAEVQQYLANALGSDLHLEHEQPFLIGPALADGDNLPLASRLADAARSVIGHCGLVGVPYGTDASKIAAAGVPSVVFGPGSIAQAHTADEWIDLQELQLAAEVYYRLVRSWC